MSISFHKVVASLGGAFILLLSNSTVQAANVQSEKILIPFSFTVQKTVLPAGKYQITQSTASSVASLVNLTTGQRASLFRSQGTHVAGKAKLVFEQEEKGYRLRQIS